MEDGPFGSPQKALDHAAHYMIANTPISGTFISCFADRLPRRRVHYHLCKRQDPQQTYADEGQGRRGTRRLYLKFPLPVAKKLRCTCMAPVLPKKSISNMISVEEQDSPVNNRRFLGKCHNTYPTEEQQNLTVTLRCTPQYH